MMRMPGTYLILPNGSLSLATSGVLGKVLRLVARASLDAKPYPAVPESSAKSLF